MSITQKDCPEIVGSIQDPETGEHVDLPCGKRAVKIERDRFGKRTCPDGHQWLPTKPRKDD